MLKRINIQSLIQANESLGEHNFNGFLKYFGIEIKKSEIEDLENLANALGEIGCGSSALDKFYVGYKIPQIGKEFDLLRFGCEFILNIELKSDSSEEKIKKQLIRNKYYLSFIGRKIFSFTFVSESKKLYSLDEFEDICEVQLVKLKELLAEQKIDDANYPDNLFDPSDYLVSPFNSTDKFLAGEYFLTHQQEEVKGHIISSIRGPKLLKFISIIGSAGAGKTLLTYDIVKTLAVFGKKALIIHCGQLNSGHMALIAKGWRVVPIKLYRGCDFSVYDLIVVDEAQRIYPKQLEEIVEKATLEKCCCIFSHDKSQTLSNWEEQRDVSSKIGEINFIDKYKLSEKIRTNKEISDFIKMLFNNKKHLPISGKDNIGINYFNDIDSAKNYLDGLNRSEWEILRFTPSQYQVEHHEKYSEESSSTSHQIIGQEFDGVVVVIDKFFSYADDGDLIYLAKTYYDSPKMLFQNITRTRKRLNIVIIQNIQILNRCIAILQ